MKLHLSATRRLVYALTAAGLVLALLAAFGLNHHGRQRALADGKTQALQMVERSAQMFLVSTVKFHDAYAAEKDSDQKEQIRQDWHRTIQAVDEAVIHDFGKDTPRVRLIGDLAITGIAPMGGDSTKIQTPFEERALQAQLAGQDVVEETDAGFYRISVPLLNTTHVGCAECHGQKAEGRIVLGSLNAYVPLGKLHARAATEALATTAAALAALTALIGFLAFYIRRTLVRPIQDTATGMLSDADRTLGSAGQIAAASQSLAEGASEQAASLEETSSSLEEMASMTRRNAENAQKANELARQARAAADRGAGDMQEMSTAMGAIKASSDEVAKIVKTIDEIAFQTNILALNAAVEAARAGEAGMGFAVVAEEVRNLAQRSAHAAKETAAKIEGAVSRTGQGVEISSKVAKALEEIVAKARQVDELAAEVAVASREQSQGIEQLNTAVSQMDKVTQNNAASAEESAGAAEDLKAQSHSLKSAALELQQLILGAAASPQVKTHKAAKPAESAPTRLPAAFPPAVNRVRGASSTLATSPSAGRPTRPAANPESASEDRECVSLKQ